MPPERNWPDIQPHVVSCFRVWVELWESFTDAHRGWWDRHGPGPVYAVPEPVVRELARAVPAVPPQHRAKGPLIGDGDAAAEHAFREVCTRYGSGTVGVWAGLPVRYDLLLPAPVTPPLSDELISQLGWDSRELMTGVGADPVPAGGIRREVAELEVRLAQTRRRLLGYVGYLTMNEAYKSEREVLRRQWSSLPDPPLFPISAQVHDQPPVASEGVVAESAPLPGEVGAFLDGMGRFLRKWQLAWMVTWDLPAPQGPIDLVPLDLAARLLGPGQLVGYRPQFFDPPASEDDREESRRRQRQAARGAGLPGDHPLAGLGGRGDDASTYESCFRLWLIEAAVRRRYREPRGLVSRLTPAFTELVGVDEERVRQLRSRYRPFLRTCDGPH
jgi:hypothetical protein